MVAFLAKMKTVLKQYLQELTDIARRGDAREESFYPALSRLLAETAIATDRPHVHVTTQPKPTDAGNPDFRLWNGSDRIIGYIEAKNPTEERLDLIEESEQLRRYRATFPNLILTNFLEFRLYRNGERVDSVLLARPRVLHQHITLPPETLIACPVMYDAASLARKTAVWATSSGVHSRPSGTLLSR